MCTTTTRITLPDTTLAGVPRTLLVTNLATHYRRPLYQRLTELLDIEFVFYSDGGEWYWNADDAGTEGLPARRLKGRWIGGTRITPGLVPLVLRTPFDVCISSLDGRFAVPISYLGARLRRRSWVLWAGVWQHPATRSSWLVRPLSRYLYRHADVILTYGRHVSRFVIAEGADPTRVWEAPQAVDLTLFTHQGRSLRPLETLHIGYVGRLEHWKGSHVLIEALRLLSDRGVSFDAQLAGAGPEEVSCRAAITAAGLDTRVCLVGQVPNEDLADFYRALDVVVIPSIESAEFTEPWSLVANEAMGCGCLVIASDAVGAAADGLVTDGSTGLVFPAGEPAALAAALERAAADADLTERLRKSGAQAVQAYSFEAAAQAFVRAVDLLSPEPAGQPRP